MRLRSPFAMDLSRSGERPSSASVADLPAYRTGNEFTLGAEEELLVLREDHLLVDDAAPVIARTPAAPVP
jgi:hypothetical protein